MCASPVVYELKYTDSETDQYSLTASASTWGKLTNTNAETAAKKITTSALLCPLLAISAACCRRWFNPEEFGLSLNIACTQAYLVIRDQTRIITREKGLPRIPLSARFGSGNSATVQN